MNFNVWDTKYNPPSKFTIAPYGSIIKVIGETIGDIVQYDLFIQASETDDMNWIDMGTFLEVAFEDKLHDHLFLAEVLSLFKKHKIQ